MICIFFTQFYRFTDHFWDKIANFQPNFIRELHFNLWCPKGEGHQNMAFLQVGGNGFYFMIYGLNMEDQLLIFLKHNDRFIDILESILFFFLSIHTATPSLEDYEQVYIVHTGFAGWKPTSNHVNYCRVL